MGIFFFSVYSMNYACAQLIGYMEKKYDTHGIDGKNSRSRHFPVGTNSIKINFVCVLLLYQTLKL